MLADCVATFNRWTKYILREFEHEKSLDAVPNMFLSVNFFGWVPMLDNTDVEESIKQVIRGVALQHDLTMSEVDTTLDIVDDLGFSSLGVVALIAELEETLNVNPFDAEGVVVTDIRTVADLIEIYRHCLSVQK